MEKIKTVEMVRHIRDAHYEELKGKSHEEKILFFRQKAHALHEKIQPPPKTANSQVSE
jgi:hypothetical protein